GALRDPTDPDGSLVANPDQWTMKEVFAAPSDLVPNTDNPPPVEVPGKPSPDELTALSYWLQQYFKAAAAEPDKAFFGNFNDIARKPEWTGILVLRMT